MWWACSVYISARGYCISELNSKCFCGTEQRLKEPHKSSAFHQGAVLLFHEPQFFFACSDIHNGQTELQFTQLKANKHFQKLTVDVNLNLILSKYTHCEHYVPGASSSCTLDFPTTVDCNLVLWIRVNPVSPQVAFVSFIRVIYHSKGWEPGLYTIIYCVALSYMLCSAQPS